jgi:hypothetical protein
MIDVSKADLQSFGKGNDDKTNSHDENVELMKASSSRSVVVVVIVIVAGIVGTSTGHLDQGCFTSGGDDDDSFYRVIQSVSWCWLCSWVMVAKNNDGGDDGIMGDINIKGDVVLFALVSAPVSQTTIEILKL